MDIAHLRRIGLSVYSDAPAMMLQHKPCNGHFAERALTTKTPTAATSQGPPGASPPLCERALATKAPTVSTSQGLPGASPPFCPCNLLGSAGFADSLVERSGRSPWLQPYRGGEDKGLVVFNSLTNEKEKFVPLEGNKVRWYTCGPTVYDVAHMGHARAYLTFDILRRIMQDYFGYELLYQINITDIDDKIILRSRQNKLFSDFLIEMESKSIQEVHAIVDSAVKAAGQKLRNNAPSEPAADSPLKDKQEFEKLSQEHDLKLKQYEELVAKVQAATDSKDQLMQAARDPMMAALDKAKGHTITDHSIFDAHSRHFENEYFKDMDALGVLRPDVVTRISEYMDGRVQAYVETLVDKGFAYASNGSVYFSIDAFRDRGYHYRKLVPAATTSAAEMAEGEGALVAETAEKRNENDFVVWKKSKPGEPAWPSPWGPGRPGWHIECSVMANDVHSEFLDIHGGGEDLKFPHHDNEMAQSEAYTERPQWVNYFLHAGHLHIEGLKMSKSLKNFITIRQALAEHTARQLRLMFLMQQWDKGMNYSDQAIEMARAEERKTKHFLGSLKFFLRRPHSEEVGDREAKLEASVREADRVVASALRDSFNTAKVIDVIARLREECYASLRALPSAGLAPVSDAADFIQRIFLVLGVEGLVIQKDSSDEWEAALDAFAALRAEVRQYARAKPFDAERVAAAAEAAFPSAAAAREANLLACAQAFESFIQDLQALVERGSPAKEVLDRCDEVRDKDFVALGVRLEDGSDDYFLWMFEDPAVMQQEAREQAEKVAAAVRSKLANKLDLKQKELKAAEKNSINPDALFKSGAYSDMFAEYDEAGVPTKQASGEPVSDKKRKDLKKELAKQQKEYEKIQKQAGREGLPAYLDSIRRELADLEAQLSALS